MEKKRCHWVPLGDPLYLRYHDEEWGRLPREESKLYEALVLELFQGGLSFRTVLSRRKALEEAFEGFDPRKAARFDEAKIEAVLAYPGVIRSEAKVRAAVLDARVFLTVEEEWGSFLSYLSSFLPGFPLPGSDPLASSASEALARDLKKRGMKFIGTTSIRSYLEAIGLIDGHEPGCFLYGELRKKAP